MNNDLISREALKKEMYIFFDTSPYFNHIIDVIDNAPTVPLPDFKEGYKQAIIDGKTNFSRPQDEEISKIKEITERALRSQDPINLYKARALDDIAEILGIEIKDPEAEETDNKDQITIDDIIKEG